MITTNLVVGISENAIGGEQDALLIKTTKDGNINVEMAFSKIGIKVFDLEMALHEVQSFLNNRPTKDEQIERSSDESVDTEIVFIPEFEFGDNVDEK